MRCSPVAWTSCRRCWSAEYLGLRPRYSSSDSIGGSSFVAHAHQAVRAIQSGQCEVALITHGETRRSNRRRGVQARPHHFDPWLPDWQWERPYGVGSPPAAYALAATRHMYEHGTTTKDLAEIAVATRAWACLNPRAYRQSRWTSTRCWPRPTSSTRSAPRLCLVTDAGGAVVLTSTTRARDLGVPVSRCSGLPWRTRTTASRQMPDLTTTPAALSGPAAFAEGRPRPR